MSIVVVVVKVIVIRETHSACRLCCQGGGCPYQEEEKGQERCENVGRRRMRMGGGGCEWEEEDVRNVRPIRSGRGRQGMLLLARGLPSGPE
jgi:hypothetical protein